VAIASNLAFIAYAYCAGPWPILALYTVMLPLNLVHLSEAVAGVSPQPDPSANIALAGIPAAWRLLLPVQRIYAQLRLRAQTTKAKPLAIQDLGSDQAPRRQRTTQRKKEGIDVRCKFRVSFPCCAARLALCVGFGFECGAPTCVR
jgi:hypothetical protein